jgi:hypothetical protein
MKYVLIAAVIVLACNSQQQKSISVIEKKDSVVIEKKKEPKVDSSWLRLQNTLRFLDSNRKYYDLAFSYDMKKRDNEILYYRTEDEKYRLLANKYDALRVKYAKICNRWSDSLQGNVQ